MQTLTDKDVNKLLEINRVRIIKWNRPGRSLFMQIIPEVWLQTWWNVYEKFKL
jgi:hypothetical protein